MAKNSLYEYIQMRPLVGHLVYDKKNNKNAANLFVKVEKS